MKRTNIRYGLPFRWWSSEGFWAGVCIVVTVLLAGYVFGAAFR